jgi:hypothetical protein
MLVTERLQRTMDSHLRVLRRDRQTPGDPVVGHVLDDTQLYCSALLVWRR